MSQKFFLKKNISPKLLGIIQKLRCTNHAHLFQKKNEHFCIVNKIIYEYLMKVKMAREKQNDLTVEKKKDK